MCAPAARTRFAKGLASLLRTLPSVYPSSRGPFCMQRALHDLTALPSGKTTIQYGPPGRSASTGHIATVFGATSFLGRYLVAKLGTCFDSLRHISLLLSLVSRRARMLTSAAGHCSQGGHARRHSLPRRGREEASEGHWGSRADHFAGASLFVSSGLDARKRAWIPGERLLMNGVALFAGVGSSPPRSD